MPLPCKSRSVFCASLLFCSAVLAQPYPSKPLHWIVPFAAGGPLDVISRAISKPLADGFGQPVIVENRASASGIVGVDAAAKAPPDGYTLLTHASLAPQKFLYRSLPYDMQRDLAPVTLIARSSLVLFVHESVPARTLDEFLLYARSNPGKLAYGSSGAGQPFHLAMELLKQRSGVDILHVPYKGAAQVIPELLAGRIQAIFFNAVPQLVAQVNTGKVRALAVAASRRMSDLPEVPTFDEAGMRDFDPAGLVAVSVPAGTPASIIERLNRDIGKTVALPEVSSVYAKLNMQPATSTPEELARIVQGEADRWGPLIRKLGLTLD